MRPAGDTLLQEQTVQPWQDPNGARVEQRRLVFLVRHGESEWNRGQSTWQMDAVCRMATRHDHPLSEQGVLQARRLEGDILRAGALRQEGGAGVAESLEELFMSSRAVLCSPLTRAVQTAVVGLRPLLRKAGDAEYLNVRLMKDIRERRALGGRDTTGSRTGAAVKIKVRAWLGMTLGESLAREYDSIIDKVDTSDVQDQWWNDRAESTQSVQERLSAFVEQLRATGPSGAPVIAVGHSHFFREVFRRYAGVHAADFRGKILCNCGVVAVSFVFCEGAEPRIVSQQLVFTSSLVDSPNRGIQLLMAASGPKSAAIASVLVFGAAGLREAGARRLAELTGALSLGLLLAQAIQRFAFPKATWAVTPLWILCAWLVWFLELGSGK